MDLKIDPTRRMILIDEPGTGVYVRAFDPERQKVDTYDIAELDKESLLAWLKSRGGDNPWAEDTVGILLGHGHLHPDTE